MDRDKYPFEETEHSRSEKHMPLELIILDMLRSALGWEQKYGSPDVAVSSSITSSTHSPLKQTPESDETEYESFCKE